MDFASADRVLSASWLIGTPAKNVLKCDQMVSAGDIGGGSG